MITYGNNVPQNLGLVQQTSSAIEDWARRSPFLALGAVVLMFAFMIKKT